MHADAAVRDGEALVQEIYEAIRGSEALWKSTALLIVFDEHGGTYDHRIPVSCTPTTQVSRNPPFAFDRLGLRVPAIIVSPLASARVSHRQYEHASIVATIRKLFLRDAGEQPLGREASANTFDVELDLMDAPRTDVVGLPRQRAMPGLRNLVPEVAPTELAMNMVHHMADALQRRFPDKPLPMNVDEVRTSRQATEFMAAARKSLRHLAP